MYQLPVRATAGSNIRLPTAGNTIEPTRPIETLLPSEYSDGLHQPML
ncbi:MULTISPECIES: hypothetical protein [Neisseria]|nr:MULTISPECIES: hypothetical protein [Neisseria]